MACMLAPLMMRVTRCLRCPAPANMQEQLEAAAEERAATMEKLQAEFADMQQRLEAQIVSGSNGVPLLQQPRIHVCSGQRRALVPSGCGQAHFGGWKETELRATSPCPACCPAAERAGQCQQRAAAATEHRCSRDCGPHHRQGLCSAEMLGLDGGPLPPASLLMQGILQALLAWPKHCIFSACSMQCLRQLLLGRTSNPSPPPRLLLCRPGRRRSWRWSRPTRRACRRNLWSALARCALRAFVPLCTCPVHEGRPVAATCTLQERCPCPCWCKHLSASPPTSCRRPPAPPQHISEMQQRHKAELEAQAKAAEETLAEECKKLEARKAQVGDRSRGWPSFPYPRCCQCIAGRATCTNSAASASLDGPAPRCPVVHAGPGSHEGAGGCGSAEGAPRPGQGAHRGGWWRAGAGGRQVDGQQAWS